MIQCHNQYQIQIERICHNKVDVTSILAVKDKRLKVFKIQEVIWSGELSIKRGSMLSHLLYKVLGLHILGKEQMLLSLLVI